MRHRLIPILLTLAACAAAPQRVPAQSAQTDLTDRGQVYTFRQVSEALVCRCGCNMILYVCNHVNCPSATPFRAQIETRIREGKGKDEIIAEFVAQHGEVVLSAPTTSGFNLAAWVAPFVMLLLGGVYVVSFLGARRRTAAARAPAPAAPVDPRVDAELRDWDDE